MDAVVHLAFNHDVMISGDMAGAAAMDLATVGAIMTMGLPPLSGDATRELLDWKPEHPGLLADLEEGHYFAR